MINLIIIFLNLKMWWKISKQKSHEGSWTLYIKITNGYLENNYSITEQNLSNDILFTTLKKQLIGKCSEYGSLIDSLEEYKLKLK